MENAARTVFETQILTGLNGWVGHYPALDALARVVAVFGVLPLAVAAVFLAICSSEGWRRWGGCVTLISVVSAVFAVRAMDALFCRPRPFLCHPVRLLLCAADGVSCPSLELGAAAALAFGLFAYTRGLRWAVFPYLVLIGVARVYCGIEYPLDQVWAVILGCTAALVTMLVLNPRFIFLKPEGWPVGAAGSLVLLAAIVLYPNSPESSLPAQQSTCGPPGLVVSAEEKNLIRGMSPAVERRIGGALLKLHLAGRIRRITVGRGESTSVAAVKFDAGPESRPLPREAIEREALAIIRATLAAAPDVSEVDVFAVTTWAQRGRRMLKVACSVAAERRHAGFLSAQPPISAAQALSRFGLVYYRAGEGE